jgi:capsular polysaccharide biosynthesis protein
MNGSAGTDSFELADYLDVLRRRWWLIVGLLCIALLGAAAYYETAPRIYTATASVYVTATGAGSNQVQNGRTNGTVNMDNEAQLVQSYTVAAIAARNLRSTVSPAQLVKNVAVAVPPNSQVLQISCSASSAAGSAACARAFGEAYLQNRSATATSALKAQLQALQGKVQSLQQNAAKLSGQVRLLPPNSTQRATAAAELRSDNSQLNGLNNQIAALTAQEANSSGGYIITAATIPGSPTSPKAALLLPGGLLVGLLIGLIIAFVADRRDTRVHSAREVESYLDLPVLLSIPAKKSDPELTLVSARSRTGQLFSELAHDVAAALGEGNHLVAVAGTAADRSGSVAATNLACTLARTHGEVLLVCADVFGSTAPQMLGLGDGRGLSELLAEKATLSEVTRQPAGNSGLKVITPGLDRAAVLYHLQHDLTSRVARQLRNAARYVIIEVPAALDTGGADTFALTEFADAALVVIELGRSRRPEVRDCARRIARLRTPVLGAMVLARLSGKPIAAVPAVAAPPADPEPSPGQPAAAATLRRTETASASRVNDSWPLSGIGLRADDYTAEPRLRKERPNPADKASGS